VRERATKGECARVCVHACVCMHMCVCVCARVLVCVFVYIHIQHIDIRLQYAHCTTLKLPHLRGKHDRQPTLQPYLYINAVFAARAVPAYQPCVAARVALIRDES